MNRFFLILILLSSTITAQQYIRFPKDQYSYLGGDEAFYKDFHKILIEKNLPPCTDKKEYVLAQILIEPDNSAKFLESDSIKPVNKCAYDLAKVVISSMDKWMPAKVDGKTVPAVDTYIIYPDDLFEKYSEGYSKASIYKAPIYKDNSEDGINDFRNDVVRRIDLSSFYFKGKGILRVETAFTVEIINGNISNLKITKSSGLKEFDEMILESIKKSSKNKWKPTSIHGIPLKYNFKLPFSVNVSRMD